MTEMDRQDGERPSQGVEAGWLGALTVALVIVLPVTILGPLDTYARNADEFSVPLNAVLIRLLPLAAAGVAVLTLLLRALPGRARIWAVALGLAVGAGFYVQANLLSWDYGQFDGTGIDWEAYRWHGLVDLLVWAALLLGAGFSRRILVRRAAMLGGALLAIQAASAAISVQAGDLNWNVSDVKQVEDGIFELSAKQNALVIVLDAFTTPAFEEVLERRPGIADDFEGFTFFRNTTGVLSTTWMSIPAILGGHVYHNERRSDDFLETVFARESLVPKLRKRGFRVDLITLKRYCRLLEADSCLSPGAVVSTDQNALEMAETIRLADLVLFRYLPQLGKRWVYSDELMLLADWFAPVPEGLNWHLSESIGVTRVVTERFHVGARDRVFKFVHLMVPHHPYQLARDCSRMPADFRASAERAELYREQSECALRLTARILRNLKSLEVYDQSTIVVVSDHGFARREYYDSAQAFVRKGIDRALPLLLVKPAGARGAMKTSLAPAENADVARTVADQLQLDVDFPGLNVLTLEEDARRVRHYYHYVWRGGWWGSDYLPPIQEYLLEGDPRNPRAWREGKEYRPVDG